MMYAPVEMLSEPNVGLVYFSNLSHLSLGCTAYSQATLERLGWLRAAESIWALAAMTEEASRRLRGGCAAVRLRFETLVMAVRLAM